MNFQQLCQAAYAKRATLASVIVSFLVGIVAILEVPRQFTLSYVGMHNQVRDYKSRNGGFAPSDDGRGIYMCCLKDVLSILALHVPLFLIYSFSVDLIVKFQASHLRDPAAISQFRCHSTSAVMLLSCLLLDTFVMIKEGYWNATPLWWNGLPESHMPFFVKLYFLVQLATLCYWLETLCFSGQTFARIRDEMIPATVNLVFCTFCYALNFGPLMMVTFLGRFSLEYVLSFVQMLSFTDLSGKRGRFVEVASWAHRHCTILELACYLILALATVVLCNRGVLEKVLIVALFGALFASSLYRWIHGRKYQLDGLQFAIGGPGAPGGAAAQGSGDPSTSRGKAATRGKSKSRK